MVIINCIVWLGVAMWMVLAAPAINTDRYGNDIIFVAISVCKRSRVRELYNFVILLPQRVTAVLWRMVPGWVSADTTLPVYR